MPTLGDYLENMGYRMGGYESVTVSVDPDSSDLTAQRLVISSDWFDLDKKASVDQFKHVYVPRYANARTIRKNGYGRYSKHRFTAPSSSTYILTVWGYGSTSSLAYNASSSTIETAIKAISADLAGITVTGTYPEFVIDLVDEDITIETDSGTIYGGLGYNEVTRPFTRALRRGDQTVVSALLPFVPQDGWTGMIEAVNMALARMPYTDRLPITITDDETANSIDITTLYPSIKTQSQIKALYNPTQWRMTASYTPPGSSTYTLTVTTYTALGTTAAIAYNASAATVQSALRAISGLELVEVTGTSPLTIVLPSTWYYNPVLTASAGTVGTTTVERLYPLRRSVSPFRLVLEGHRRILEIDDTWPVGHTLFIQAERQGDSSIAYQTDYQTAQSTTWTEGEGLRLVGWSDQAPLDVNDVGAVAYWLACVQMMSKGPEADRKFWAEQELRAGQAAVSIKLSDLPVDPGLKSSVGLSGQGTWGTKGWVGW